MRHFAAPCRTRQPENAMHGFTFASTFSQIWLGETEQHVIGKTALHAETVSSGRTGAAAPRRLPPRGRTLCPNGFQSAHIRQTIDRDASVQPVRFGTRYRVTFRHSFAEKYFMHHIQKCWIFIDSLLEGVKQKVTNAMTALGVAATGSIHRTLRGPFDTVPEAIRSGSGVTNPLPCELHGIELNCGSFTSPKNPNRIHGGSAESDGEMMARNCRSLRRHDRNCKSRIGCRSQRPIHSTTSAAPAPGPWLQLGSGQVMSGASGFRSTPEKNATAASNASSGSTSATNWSGPTIIRQPFARSRLR